MVPKMPQIPRTQISLPLPKPLAITDVPIISIVVQLLSHVQLFVTPWTAIRQASLSFTISQRLLKLLSIESVILSNSLVLCCPLLLSPSIHFCVCAKLLQSCLTLCDPLYCHPPGSSVYGILSSKLRKTSDRS